jgi:hypothetical protein
VLRAALKECCPLTALPIVFIQLPTIHGCHKVCYMVVVRYCPIVTVRFPMCSLNIFFLRPPTMYAIRFAIYVFVRCGTIVSV